MLPSRPALVAGDDPAPSIADELGDRSTVIVACSLGKYDA
jgi:hypothetical protein